MIEILAGEGMEEVMQLSEARDILNDMYFEREQQHEKTLKKISTSPRLILSDLSGFIL